MFPSAGGTGSGENLAESTSLACSNTRGLQENLSGEPVIGPGELSSCVIVFRRGGYLHRVCAETSSAKVQDLRCLDHCIWLVIVCALSLSESGASRPLSKQVSPPLLLSPIRRRLSALFFRQRAKCNAQTLSCLGSRVERRASLGTVVGSHPFLFAPPLRRTSIRHRSAVNPSVKDVEGAPLFWVFRLSSWTAARYRRTRKRFTSATITGARRATSLSVWMLIKVLNTVSCSVLKRGSLDLSLSRATLEALSGSFSSSRSTHRRQRSA